MWKAVTFDQSIPLAETRASRNSFCDGAAAKITETGFFRRSSRSFSAAASPAARPRAPRSTKTFACSFSTFMMRIASSMDDRPPGLKASRS
jgi:hypothetical protein